MNISHLGLGCKESSSIPKNTKKTNTQRKSEKKTHNISHHCIG
jgi:hypothetical protein